MRAREVHRFLFFGYRRKGSKFHSTKFSSLLSSLFLFHLHPPHSMESKPLQRLNQVASHLGKRDPSRADRPHHSARFRPILPSGLPVNFTPLNPLSFLLKAAAIRPDHTAIAHPQRNLEISYRDWLVSSASLRDPSC